MTHSNATRHKVQPGANTRPLFTGHLENQGQGPYAKDLKKLENDIKDAQKRVNEKIGVKESDTGLAPPALWDIPADKQRMGEEQPLQASGLCRVLSLERRDYVSGL